MPPSEFGADVLWGSMPRASTLRVTGWRPRRNRSGFPPQGGQMTAIEQISRLLHEAGETTTAYFGFPTVPMTTGPAGTPAGLSTSPSCPRYWVLLQSEAR